MDAFRLGPNPPSLALVSQDRSGIHSIGYPAVATVQVAPGPVWCPSGASVSAGSGPIGSFARPLKVKVAVRRCYPSQAARPPELLTEQPAGSEHCASTILPSSGARHPRLLGSALSAQREEPYDRSDFRVKLKRSPSEFLRRDSRLERKPVIPRESNPAFHPALSRRITPRVTATRLCWYGWRERGPKVDHSTSTLL